MSNIDDSIGFLGLGALGLPIAENLLASGNIGLFKRFAAASNQPVPLSTEVGARLEAAKN